MKSTPWQESHHSPEVLTRRADGDVVSVLLSVDGGLAQFQGHFPGTPVFPGVGQLNWAVDFARREFSIAGAIEEVANLKFRNYIKPNQHIWLELEYQREKSRVVFKFYQGAAVFSSGILKFPAP